MGRRLRQFADPTVICSVVLLLLNDRVFKGNGPAWLTGKLSDFAGVYLVAMIMGIVTARPDLAVATTAVGFFAIKVSYGAAHLVSPMLGGVTRQDHTDLIALVALVPAWFVLRRSPSPLVSGTFGALLATTALVFAGVGVTATSCISPNAVDAFAVDSAGHLIAHIEAPRLSETQAGDVWAQSEDGGVTWRPIPDPGLAAVPQPRACDRTGQCFRVIEGSRVEQSNSDGTWSTAFRFTAEQRRRMDWRSGMCDSPGDGFRSILVVDEQPLARVVVAMGSQGVLVRTPDGEWHRYAVLDRAPLSLSVSIWLTRVGLGAPLLGFLLTPILYGVARWRGGKARAVEIARDAAIIQAVILVVAGATLFLELDEIAPVAIVVVAAAVIGLLLSVVRALTARAGPAPVAIYPPPPTTLPPPPPPPPLS